MFLELKVLGLGVDTFSGQGINDTEMAREVAETLICDAIPSRAAWPC